MDEKRIMGEKKLWKFGNKNKNQEECQLADFLIFLQPVQSTTSIVLFPSMGFSSYVLTHCAKRVQYGAEKCSHHFSEFCVASSHFKRVSFVFWDNSTRDDGVAMHSEEYKKPHIYHSLHVYN